MTFYNIIHGVEIWLAISIWALGVVCGIVWSWIMVGINRGRDDEQRK